MNIEKKNTLFVVSLVLMVLVGVGLTAFYLIRQHVNQQIDNELKRAHAVFVEAQKQSFNGLLSTAQRYRSAPGLISAASTSDAATIREVLRGLVPRADVDMMALYMGDGRGEVVGQSRNAVLSSPQLLNSQTLRALVRSALRRGEPAIGHSLVFDSLVRLAAIPIQDPVGGELGVLLLGELVSGGEVDRVHELVRADVVLYNTNLVLASTLEDLRGDPGAIPAASRADRLLDFDAAGNTYFGRSYPILDRPGGEEVASLLLAVSRDSQWGPYQALARSALYFSLLILLVAALVGIWVSRGWFAKPLKALVGVTASIGSGDLDVAVDESRNDEIGMLGRAFNRMLGRLKDLQELEAQSKQRFHDFAESSSDWVWETNADGKFTFVSQHVEQALAMGPDELIGRDFGEVFPDDNLSEIMSLLRPLGERVVPLKDVEAWITTREGMRLCFRVSGMPYHEDHQFKGFRGTARDITKVKNDEERLLQLANRDHLTGLSNRRRFMEDLEREVQIAERQNQSGTLLLIDLDHFKLVNDTAGHAAGDEVLVQVAGMLRGIARSMDLVARLSGDEFVVALINTASDQAIRRAEEILRYIAQQKPTYAGRILNTSASIGIAVFPKHGLSPAELLAKADTAMYAAKQQGRNRVHLYSEDDMAQELMDSQLTWKERILEALEDDRFELRYQPIAPSDGGPVGRFEVLVRLRAADNTVHMPGSFIPMAEQFGLIQRVDAVIVRKAVEALGQHPNPNICFSINLSALSLGDTNMLAEIERTLQTVTFDRSRIVFEITESAACQDISRASGFISRIREMGCRTALDDFGVGFSSFSYLKHLKVDIIKIDGSFVRDIQNSREDQLFVKALVDVASGLGIQTVAEFVESRESLDKVRELGVEYVQGYYIGQALPAPDEDACASERTDHTGQARTSLPG